MDLHVRWKLALALTLLGGGVLLAGALVGGNDRGAWSGVLIEVGAGVALVAVVAWLERRLMERVSDRADSVATAAATETATTVATQATADLRERLTRLESLSQTFQDQIRAQEDFAASVVQRLREDVSFSTVAGLLREARNRSYFAHDFRVRGADTPECHELYLHLDDYSFLAAEAGPRIRLSFSADEPGTGFIGVDDLDNGRRDDSIDWTGVENAKDVARSLVRLLERSNLPLDGFSFGYAIQRLADSFLVMQAARSAVAGDPSRLEGELKLLINDGWVLTTSGLECTRYEHVIPVTESGFRGSVFVRGEVRLPSDLRDVDDPPLLEALEWVTERLGVKVINGG